MRLNKESFEVKANTKNFDAVRTFAEERMARADVSDAQINESTLVLEELFVRIVNQIKNTHAIITVTVEKRLSEVLINLEYDGARFALDIDSEDTLDPGAEIIRRYEDRIETNYRQKHNLITLEAQSIADKIFERSIIAMILAALVYAVLHMFITHGQELDLLDGFVFPVERMFGTAMLMISAPVTFFSLVSNMTDVRLYSTTHKGIHGLVGRVIWTSSIALLLALVYFEVLDYAGIFEDAGMEIYKIEPGEVLSELSQFSNIIPADIFKAFTVLSPIPLLLLALLASASLSTMNKNFDTMKAINDAFYSFFGQALNIIMMFLPIASFFAIFDELLDDGFSGLSDIAVYVVACFLGVLLLLGYYLWRLIYNKINPVAFLKKSMPAMIENFKINSSIDAIPYNTRFMNRVFKINMKFLDEELPLFSKINLEGNCFFLFLFGLSMDAFMGDSLSHSELFLMAILILILSVGSPSHSGGTIIGLTIIFSYVGVSMDLVCIGIYFEALFCRVITIVNTFSNYVTIAIDAKNRGYFSADVLTNGTE